MVAGAVAQWVAAPVATTVTGAGGDTPELSAPANTVLPSTSGSTVVGGTRNGAAGTWTGNPAPTFAYQWQRDEGGGSWVDMEGKTSINWLIDDVGDFRLEVTATNDQGSSVAYSAPFAAALPLTAPVNTSVPTTSGSDTVGGTRNGNRGTWTGNPTPTYTYQWQQFLEETTWANISGATDINYDLTDPGTFRLQVTGTNSQGAVEAVSASFVATAAVQNGTVGSTATDGDGNWGFQIDRAMGNTFTLPHDATLKMGHLYIIPASGSGSGALKLCVYTNNAGAAGNFICESNQIVISEAGWADFPFNDDIVPAQDIHIIAVTGETSGAGWDMGSFNSGGQPAARIYTAFDYNNPPSPAPAPDAQYNNGLSINIDYEYTA